MLDRLLYLKKKDMLTQSEIELLLKEGKISIDDYSLLSDIELDLDVLKEVKIAELDSKCNKDILSGFVCNIKSEDRLFGYDYDDQFNLTGKLARLSADLSITEVTWKCKGLDGIVDTYTRDEFLTICESADDVKTKKMAKFWTLKSQVLNSTTIEELDSSVW